MTAASQWESVSPTPASVRMTATFAMALFRVRSHADMRAPSPVWLPERYDPYTEAGIRGGDETCG